MNVDRHFKLARSSDGQPQWFERPAGMPARLGMRFDSLDEVAVLSCGGDDRLGVDPPGAVKVDIFVPQHAAGQIGGDEAVRLGSCHLGNEFSKSRDGDGAGAALIDHSRDAGADTDQIGIDAEIAGNMLEDMAMEIDETRQDRRSICCDELFCPHPVELSDGGDPFIGHGDVAPLVEAENRIKDAGVANQQIALLVHDIPPDDREHSGSGAAEPPERVRTMLDATTVPAAASIDPRASRRLMRSLMGSVLSGCLAYFVAFAGHTEHDIVPTRAILHT